MVIIRRLRPRAARDTELWNTRPFQMIPCPILMACLATGFNYQPAPASGPGYAFPVVAHVAVVAADGRAVDGDGAPSSRGDRRPVVDRAWLDDQIGWANRLFADHGVTFVLARQLPLAADHAFLEDRADRHALGAYLEPNVINWFVVAALRDVDEPRLMRRGVHWRADGDAQRNYVIVSAIAGSTVLAHELGHYFGNHQHSDTPGNIMSYSRGDMEPFFDRVQSRRIGAAARGYVLRGIGRRGR